MQETMTNPMSSPTPYDYRQYDRIWQRVDPTLNPYPSIRNPEPKTTAMTPKLESLPGAESDPCCMGSAAMEMLGVLEGYIEVELGDRWYYLALQRCAPTASRTMLRDFAHQKGVHAKRLMAVYYLITGKCYESNVICGQMKQEAWCETLRQRYHAEACGGMNYARSADGTTDPCLHQLLEALSAATYAMAEKLLVTLEKNL
ncbi:ferritin-like domain-containing protein [Bengtsoniella intestinalis]|uniref:ferritin-like domain-containing protein n=1 Tax=Bengtsoniella intestinalis TaxID=3073143 RepID=UPI00391F94F3